MIEGSCVNFSACSRLSVGLKDIVETLTGDAAILIRLTVNSFVLVLNIEVFQIKFFLKIKSLKKIKKNIKKLF